MRRTAVIGIVVLLAVVVVGLVVSSLRSRGPSYQGKSVDFWLRQVFGGRQREAMEAFRAMGPEALPQLLKALKRNDSAFDRFYQGVYPRLPDVVKDFLVQPVSVSADEIRAAASLVLLNSEHARRVLPQLAELLKTTNASVRMHVISLMAHHLRPGEAKYLASVIPVLDDSDPRMREAALGVIGKIQTATPSVIQALSGLLTNETVEVRLAAARTLWKLNRETNATVPVLKAALLERLTPDYRHWVAVSLMEISLADPEPIAVFIDSLKEGTPGLRISAAYSLARYGPVASNAVEALLQIFPSSSGEVRKAVGVALQQIDPEAAAKAGAK